MADRIDGTNFQIIQLYYNYNVAEDHTDVFLTKLGYENPKYFRAPVGLKQLDDFYSKCFQDSDPLRVFDFYYELEEKYKEYMAYFKPLISFVDAYSKPGDILWIIPDGLLHYLPFAAIPCQGEPLIKRNPIVYSPSVTAMTYCRHWRRRITIQLLEGKRRSFLGMAIAPENDEQIVIFLDEVQKIAKNDWWETTDTLSGTKATKATFIQKAKESDVIHISCHGDYAPNDPLDSYLLVSNGSELPLPISDNPIPDHFKIKARDLLGQKLGCDLIILAACWTGRSKLFVGDTRLGLSDAFLATKTNSLIVSQWAAATDSTNYLLKQFYHYWLGEKALPTKAHALQQAMIDTMESTKQEAIKQNWRLPSFWGNFILIGDWE